MAINDYYSIIIIRIINLVVKGVEAMMKMEGVGIKKMEGMALLGALEQINIFIVN